MLIFIIVSLQSQPAHLFYHIQNRLVKVEIHIYVDPIVARYEPLYEGIHCHFLLLINKSTSIPASLSQASVSQ